MLSLNRKTKIMHFADEQHGFEPAQVHLHVDFFSISTIL